MSEQTATPEAPQNTPSTMEVIPEPVNRSAMSGNSRSERDFLKDTQTVKIQESPQQRKDFGITESATAPIEPAKTPTPDVTAQQEQIPAEPQKIMIRDWQGNPKEVTIDWFGKYFQFPEEVQKLITPENQNTLVPILSHVAEMGLKLNSKLISEGKAASEYKTYQTEVQQFFDDLYGGLKSDTPEQAVFNLLDKMNFDDGAKEKLAYKLAEWLVMRKDMSPEQRAAEAAQKEAAKIRSENERLVNEQAQIRAQMDAERRAPMYRDFATKSMTARGIQINDRTMDAMSKMAIKLFGTVAEDLTAQHFDYVASQLAEQIRAYGGQIQAQKPAEQALRKPVPRQSAVKPATEQKNGILRAVKSEKEYLAETDPRAIYG